MKRVDHTPPSAVTAGAAKGTASAANAPVVELRRGRGVQAGAFVYEGPALESRWHRHDLHQLEYSTRGALSVASTAARFVCPPHEALWIAAGTPHMSLLGAARTISVFFAPELAPNLGASGVRVLQATPLLREMIAYAARWRIDRTAPDALADAYFSTMGALLPEWLQLDGPWTLPVSEHPGAAAALSFTLAHLADATPLTAARAAGVSERGLRRLFASEVGISWSAYLTRARLLRAMTLLSATDYTVLRIAHEVGFDSATSLSRALRAWTGSTPSRYRLARG
jgi:AraC-like DNA-binding protein